MLGTERQPILNSASFAIFCLKKTEQKAAKEETSVRRVLSVLRNQWSCLTLGFGVVILASGQLENSTRRNDSYGSSRSDFIRTTFLFVAADDGAAGHCRCCGQRPAAECHPDLHRRSGFGRRELLRGEGPDYSVAGRPGEPRRAVHSVLCGGSGLFSVEGGDADGQGASACGCAGECVVGSWQCRNADRADDDGRDDEKGRVCDGARREMASWLHAGNDAERAGL